MPTGLRRRRGGEASDSCSSVNSSDLPSTNSNDGDYHARSRAENLEKHESVHGVASGEIGSECSEDHEGRRRTSTLIVESCNLTETNKLKKAELGNERLISIGSSNVARHAEVGGKGGNLLKCTRAGFPVPAFFVITGEAFLRHLESSGVMLSHIDESRRCLLEAPLEKQLVDEVTKAYSRLSEQAGTSTPLCAVRSSSSAEDGKSASFAGQMETFLGVSGVTDILMAMRHCWASVYADRVQAYRELAGSAGTCCVVVQLLIEAESAGVLFTANPLSGSRQEFVITANWGIGESVVADMTPPDTIIVSAKEGVVISSTVASKKVMVSLVKSKTTPGGMKSFEDVDGSSDKNARNNDGHKGLNLAQAKSMPIPQNKQDVICLSQDAIHQLWELGKKVQDHYGGEPQDIEWAVNADGKVVLLQARPVTTLQHLESMSDDPLSSQCEPTVDEFNTPNVRDLDWITTCNAQEMFPGAGTPLTISVFGSATEYAMQMLHVDFGMMPAPDLKRPRLPWVSGHFFINMTNTFYMLTQMVGGKMGKSNGEMSILGRINDKLTMEQLCEAAGGSPLLPVRLLNSIKYIYTIATAGSRISTMKERCAAAPSMLQCKDGDADILSMYDRIAAFIPTYNQQWADGVMCGSTSAAWMLLVMKLVIRDQTEMWSTHRVSEIAAALASAPDGESEVESADVVKKLDEIKAAISEHPDAHKFAIEWRKETPKALAWIEPGGAAGDILAQLFVDLLDRHGHRCVKEAEFRNEEWSESPQVLVKLLQSGVAAMLKLKEADEKASDNNDVQKVSDFPDTDRFEMLLKNEWSHVSCVTRPLLRFAVRKAREGVSRRELGKSLQVRLHSHLKHAFRVLGRALVRHGKIPELDLIYFLTLDELGVLCGATSDTVHYSASDLRLRAIKRRRLFPIQERFKFSDLVQGRPKPIADRNLAAGEIGFSTIGTPVSRGNCEGFARVVRTLEEAAELKPGEILICPFTDVGWTPYFSLASGLVTEIGGLLSHGAVCAREYNLPCIVNVKDACSRFRTGAYISMNGVTGKIHVLEDNTIRK